jgi:hypothetical protein
MGDTASLAGTGSWNGAPGYTFTAKATDVGRRSGRGSDGSVSADGAGLLDRSAPRDRLAVTIRDATGAIVWAADWPLRSGNIVIKRASAGHDDDEDRARTSIGQRYVATFADALTALGILIGDRPAIPAAAGDAPGGSSGALAAGSPIAW